MRFVYKPEGIEPKSWPFDPQKLLNVELMAIEKATGLTYEDFVAGLSKSSMTALTGLLWVLLRRSDPTLKFDAVQFCQADIDFAVEPGDEEDTLAALEAAEAEGRITPAGVKALADLRAAGVTAAPKADAPKTGADTSS